MHMLIASVKSALSFDNKPSVRKQSFNNEVEVYRVSVTIGDISQAVEKSYILFLVMKVAWPWRA